MSDDIFDYFSGNATRKVEPIEDDDDDIVEAVNAQTDDLATESGHANASQPDAEVEKIELVDSTGSDVAVASSAGTETSSTDRSAEESGGHWDFLAGFLGIRGAKPKADSDKSMASSAPEQVAQDKAETAVETSVQITSDQPDQQDQADEVEPVAGTVESESRENDDDLFAAFAGFSSPTKPRNKKTKLDSDSNFATSGTRRESQQQGNDPAATDFFGLDEVPSPEDDTPLKSMFTSAEETLGRANVADGEDFIEFEVRDLIEPSDENSDADRGSRRRRRGRGRSQSDRSERDSWSDSGQRSASDRSSEDRSVGDLKDAYSEDDERLSRRKRGRGRGGRGRGPKPEVVNEQTTHDGFLSDSDIGWDLDADDRSEVSSRSGVVERINDTESEDDGDRPKRRRSRRGGRGRGRRDSEQAIAGRDEVAFDDRSSRSSNREDADRYANDGAGRSGRRGDRDRGDSDRGGRRARVADVPTWDDAITDMIQNNIKNHKNSSRGGRSSGGGRGGRSSQRGRGRRNNGR